MTSLLPNKCVPCKALTAFWAPLINYNKRKSLGSLVDFLLIIDLVLVWPNLPKCLVTVVLKGGFFTRILEFPLLEGIDDGLLVLSVP